MGEGEKRIALVIGNAAYETAAVLANPVNDALKMAEALRRLGFEVGFARDCKLNEFNKQLREFTRKLGESDVALLYYSGHALNFGGENFLIPIDARLEEPDDLVRGAFRLSEQLAAMRSAARVSLIFLDACRDAPFTLDNAGPIAGTKGVVVRQPGLKQIGKTELRGAFIAFAAEEGHTATDGPEGGLSPFTDALTEHIETPGLGITDMMQRVTERVWQGTGGRQTPWSNQSLTKEFFFKPGVPPRPPVSEPEPLFEIYKAKDEPFYVERGVDQRILAATSTGHVWISGPSGFGKTTVLRHSVLASGRRLMNLLLGAYQARGPKEVLRAVCVEFAEALSVETQVKGAGVAELVAAFRRLARVLATRDTASTILVEEFPLLAGPPTREFLKLLLQLVLTIEADDVIAGRIHLAFSSINDPTRDLGEGVPKLRENFQFFSFSPWSDGELIKLIELLRPIFKPDLRSGDRDAILKAANGSPRYVKMVFRHWKTGQGDQLTLTELLAEISAVQV
jgi:uncharacterized caspase-like protein